MESGPCQLIIGELPCPCAKGRFDVTLAGGPLDPGLACQDEDCHHQLQYHFFTYSNLASRETLSPPSTDITALALYKQPLSGQPTSARRLAVRRDAIQGIEHGKRLEVIDRADDLLKRIRSQTPEDPLDLATPAEKLIALPFPSLLPTLPRGRFDLDRESNWGYMAREKFKELLQGAGEPLEEPDAGLWFYGTIGYGKSHLLAALVCYLLSTGSQVVYIPDCQQCLRDPIEYVRAAMVLAWAGNPALQMKILDLETRLDILGFFNDRATEGCWVVFVIDQMSALEPIDSNSDSADDLRNKESLEAWLYECSSQHMTIVGLSANNISFPRLQESKKNYLRVNAYGGLTEAEMKYWWQRNKGVKYAGYTKHQFEDITGSIPLLLDGCVVNGEIDLSALPLMIVSEQVLQFMEEQNRKYPGVWNRYWKYMKACVAHGAVPNNMSLNAIDQRYSFEETVMGERIGSYTCGAAREAIAKWLCQYGGIPKNFQEILEPLRWLLYNQSAAEFFVKRAAMAVIGGQGLRIGKNVIPRMDVVPYSGDFPDISAQATGGSPKLYFPLKPDLGIDGIIVRVNNRVGLEGKQCRLFPLQIAVTDAKTESEELFVSRWSHWINTRGFAAVEVQYIWIVGSGSPREWYVGAGTNTRHGLGFRGPPYTRQVITLRDLSPQIFTELRYAQTRRAG